MTLRTQILYRLRYIASSLADVTITALAVAGALLVPFGLWYGGWARIVALGVAALCAVLFLAAGILASQVDDEWTRK